MYVLLYFKNWIPLRAVGSQLNNALGADGHHHLLSFHGFKVRQPAFIDRHIGDSQIPCQQLNVRQYVAFSGCQDAGHRRKIFGRRRKHINSGGVKFRIILAGFYDLKDTACQPGI